MTLSFRGAEINYSVVGKGEATILLHGFLESSQIWEEFLPEFTKYGKIITIDLPGHGKSEVISEVHSMELMAEAVYKVLEATDVKKANFIGHSMGGYVGLALMEQHPELIRDFMLLNSTPLADSEEKKENRDRSAELVEKNKQAYVSMAIKNLLSPANSERFSDEIQKLITEASHFPSSGITAALKGMKIRTDRTEVLKDFSGRKVIVAGKEDPLVNIPDLEVIANDVGATFICFSGGHLSYIENKKEFVKLCISSKKK